MLSGLTFFFGDQFVAISMMHHYLFLGEMWKWAATIGFYASVNSLLVLLPFSGEEFWLIHAVRWSLFSLLECRLLGTVLLVCSFCGNCVEMYIEIVGLWSRSFAIPAIYWRNYASCCRFRYTSRVIFVFLTIRYGLIYIVYKTFGQNLGLKR